MQANAVARGIVEKPMSELDIPKLPPEAEALLKDPRLEGMADALPGFPPEERLLTPENPPSPGESPYLLMGEAPESAGGKVTWINRPAGTMYLDRVGRGRGLAELRDRPRLEESGRKPREPLEIWRYLNWLVAGPRVVEVLSRFDASAIDPVEIDWTYGDGQRLEDYAFLDVRRLIHAYDYRRTAALIRRDRGRTFLARLGLPRALKPISDPDVHVFRDAYYRADIFMSRPLAEELSIAGIRGIYFEDPANAAAVRFDRS